MRRKPSLVTFELELKTDIFEWTFNILRNYDSYYIYIISKVNYITFFVNYIFS